MKSCFQAGQSLNPRKRDLQQIEEGELCLEGSYNYEYDDWYNSEVDEFLFSDPNGVVDILEKAGAFVHCCVDREKYTYGYEIAEMLVGLKIDAERDEWDGLYETPSIGELESHGLSDMDYGQVVTEGLYLAYCAHDMPERADGVSSYVIRS